MATKAVLPLFPPKSRVVAARLFSFGCIQNELEKPRNQVFCITAVEFAEI
jgi:hypothetical protein